MASVTLTGLGKFYGAQEVFQDVAAQIEPADRIGLVGPNGQGKTTLLRCIAGQEEPSAGRIESRRGLSVGYLPQHAELLGDKSLYAAMLPAFEELIRQQAALRELETQMAQPACLPAVVRLYGELEHRFELAGGYTFETQICQVLAGLGFSEEEFDKSLAIMSGGQRTRAMLARVLLEAPDLLLLDEPTNHLDLAGVEWLEGYLAGWKGGLVVVAHDRRFLDRLVTRVWDLALGRLETYDGNYTRYVEQRAERMTRRLAEYEAQQEQIAETEYFIQRYKAGQRAKEARGRLARLERLERLERPQEVKRIHLDIQTDMRSGDIVLRTRALQVGFAGPPRLRLFDCPDLLLQRGERAALLGPNGAGKTTLLRTILGTLPPLAGETQIGASVRLGYLAQAHAGLKLEHTVLDEILETRNLPIEKARHYLGRFLFSGDEVHKPIHLLSGGERSRVALAKLTLEGANFLVLDEPTNHLDIASQEILEEVLSQFRGTILLVSHDRQFVDGLATQIWLIRDDTLVTFKGNYSEYLASLESGPAVEAARKADAGRKRDEFEERRERTREDRRVQREERRRQERAQELERTAADLEAALAGLGRQIEAASVTQRMDEVFRLGREYEQTQRQLEHILEEWAALA
jgi:ATP-binding cassette subfamily F protein 3